MSKKAQPLQPLYIFLDESGNFDFSPNGTPYLVFGCISMTRPFTLLQKLSEARYDLLEEYPELDLEYFHATEDKQITRNKVFRLIKENIKEIQTEVIIVEKRKANPTIRPIERFYPMMISYLLKYAIGSHDINNYSEIIIITDRIPINSKRKAVEKAVKTFLAKQIPNTKYRILHHDSKSNLGLQLVDYVIWAIAKKWKDNDRRSYKEINSSIRNEFPIFQRGQISYY